MKNTGHIGISRRTFAGTPALPLMAAAVPSLPPHVPDEKEQFSFLTGEDFVEKHNIAWRVELADEDPGNPLIEPQYPWDDAGVFSHGTVMLDPTDGLWKMWYISTPQRSPAPSAERRLTYAESKDGARWTRPMLDVAPWQGRTPSNILFDLDSGGPSQHASVLVHPDAPRAYRYEMFIMRSPGYYCPYRIVKGFPLPAGQTSHKGGIYRYRSADGKHWHAWEAINLETSDSLWFQQSRDGSYVAYHKTEIPAPPGGLVPYDIAFGGCRIMARRTSPNGTVWSPFELALTPDWLDSHGTQFMELIAVPQRGGFIGLVTVYHALNQFIDVQFAASRDGRRWWRPDRRACLPLRPLGDTGGGMIWPLQPLIQQGGRIYIYYSGCEGLHNDFRSTEPAEKMRASKLPQWPHQYRAPRLGNDTLSPVSGCAFFYGSLCRAWWTEGRLWAAVTAAGGPTEGLLATPMIRAGGRRLYINTATVRDGAVEAELLNGDGRPIAGYTRQDCVPFRGDSRTGMLRWKAGDRCPQDEVRLRLYLRRARLYGFDWNA